MKKIFALFLLLTAVMTFAVGCGSQVVKDSSTGQTEEKKPTKIKIVTTIFPLYDWTRQIVGERFQDIELTMLLNNGVDLHSYQPTSADIMKISDCDLFIYVGGESDEWIDDALKEAVNKNMVVLNLMDALGDKVKREELVEGMEKKDHDDDKNHEHHHEHKHKHDEKEEIEYDEHIWLSLKNARILCQAIDAALEKADASHADVYKKNAEAYLSKLTELDGKYRQTVDAAPHKTLIFGDRFPFRYLTDDYGLKYYAAFLGCSAETEASFETIAFLTGKINELKPAAVLVLENKSHQIAETMVRNSAAPGTEILVMDSMQGTTEQAAANGASYLDVMEKNLSVLKTALR